MVELLRYLEAGGFVTYIASGGDRDFMRPVAEDMYGIPPERIIGSALGIMYSSEGGQSALLYKGAMDFFDDGPVRIWSRIGDGQSSPSATQTATCRCWPSREPRPRPRFDCCSCTMTPSANFDYTAGAEQALETASRENWTVVSMKNDWAEIFPTSAS